VRVKTTSAGRRHDLFDLCGRLELVASPLSHRRDEAEFLAALIRALLRGGRVTVEQPGRESFVWVAEGD